ncbi:hypothetical protein AQUCO_06900062v1 [Aquilegia coerulea]|uniref:Uncharacterized protein n=1 Tax=Aquilegia coerulea TaxID=218851 RepID=A0A2G5CBA0_AQUCA|nr:hypothetical protein AQUCO_06900062v1 [Aquilegia coerulea]
MLLKSMGKLKPITNPPTARPHTRGWERQRTNNDPNIQNIDEQKKTFFSSWKTCCCCEMTESRTQKRKRKENISDAPSMSTSRSKVPKLKNASLHMAEKKKKRKKEKKKKRKKEKKKKRKKEEEKDSKPNRTLSTSLLVMPSAIEKLLKTL